MGCCQSNEELINEKVGQHIAEYIVPFINDKIAEVRNDFYIYNHVRNAL